MGSATTSSPGVLVVDDNAANRIALAAVLHPLGVRVVEAKSGVEATERVANDSFAVVLLDVQLPDMDGFEVARRIRATPHGHELPIIFLTAIHRDEVYARQGYASGGADYITKPFDADIVRARVKAFVDLFHQRDELRVQQVGQRTRERDEALEKLEALLESERSARRDAEIASRAKDEFLATMSHELRTPLTAILGWAVIARQHPVSPEVEHALATIERNARAQTRMIEDLLDIGRATSGKLRLDLGPVNVADTIHRAVDALLPAATAKGVTVSVDIAPDVGAIVADADRLQQIVSNLVSNAIKFTRNGGHVGLDATQSESSVVIGVRDTGQGIAPSLQPFIFEAFRQGDGSTTTRRHGGLGLGLAIVKQLVSAHGGTVTAHSEGEGKGATFTVELPSHAAPRSRSSPAAPHVEETDLHALNVLIVDDDEDARDLFAHVLSSRGAVVSAASSAEEALRAINAKRPDVVVSDIAMPGTDGYGLIRQIRALPAERGGAVPALAVTAHAGPDFSQRAFAAGFQAHLSKPLDPLRLVDAIALLGKTPRAILGQ